MALNPYRVQLEMFEGPLDLLLFLIRKDEIDIYDIPLAEITGKFLRYVEQAKEIHLANAGDYVLMAATLLKMKARMLLPAPEDEQGGEVEDPRTELVNMLLEYKRFKEAAQELALKEDIQSRYFYRIPAPVEAGYPVEPEESLAEVQLYDIMATFQDLLKRHRQETFHEVQLEEITVTEQKRYLLDMLAAKEPLSFLELMQQLQSRLVIVVTFLALLECLRDRTVRVVQKKMFEDLLLYRGVAYGAE